MVYNRFIVYEDEYIKIEKIEVLMTEEKEIKYNFQSKVRYNIFNKQTNENVSVYGKGLVFKYIRKSSYDFQTEVSDYDC